ncbi:MAG: hypothetical protein ABI646_03495 [Acidobacteriota bacterium]
MNCPGALARGSGTPPLGFSTADKRRCSPDVVRSLQMLLNARARREAMESIDRGDRVEAFDQISFCLASSEPAPADVRDADTFRDELNDLESLRASLETGEDDAMVRKQMAYRRESVRKGR